MGLESVEIVMAVEEAFDITIQDSEAEKVATPGRLIALVLSKVGRTTHAACLTQRAFHRLRASLLSQSRIPRHQIKVKTSLSNLFPRSARKEHLRRFLTAAGLQKEMELVRPQWLHQLIWVVTLSGGIGIAAYFAWHPIASKSMLVNFLLGSPIIPSGFFLCVFGWFAYFATRPLQVEFPPSLANVGQLSRWMVAMAPEVVKAPPGPWSREQVSAKIRRIVVDYLDCELAYHEDAHFIKDLGMD